MKRDYIWPCRMTCRARRSDGGEAILDRKFEGAGDAIGLAVEELNKRDDGACRFLAVRS